MRDQLLRSSRSVTANIAEGFGRYHYQENVQFCRQSRGSLSETLDHLICACDEGYISEQEFADLRKQVDKVWRLLNGYIRYLVHRSKAKQSETMKEVPPEYSIPPSPQ